MINISKILLCALALFLLSEQMHSREEVLSCSLEQKKSDTEYVKSCIRENGTLYVMGEWGEHGFFNFNVGNAVYGAEFGLRVIDIQGNIFLVRLVGGVEGDGENTIFIYPLFDDDSMHYDAVIVPTYKEMNEQRK